MKEGLQPRYLGRREIAEIYGLSPKWLANLASEGKGPIYRKLGKKVLYSVKDFEQWIKETSIEIKTQRN